jgi:hypothetical protein
MATFFTRFSNIERVDVCGYMHQMHTLFLFFASNQCHLKNWFVSMISSVFHFPPTTCGSSQLLFYYEHAMLFRSKKCSTYLLSSLIHSRYAKSNSRLLIIRVRNATPCLVCRRDTSDM